MEPVRYSGITSNRASILMLFPEARRTPLLFSTASWETDTQQKQSTGHEVHVEHETNSKCIFSTQAVTIVFLPAYLKFTVHSVVKSGRLERLIVVNAFLLL